MNNKLKEIRMKKGLSQFALAKLSDVSPSDISKIESGTVRAYPRWRKRLAQALEVSEEDLFPGLDALRNEKTRCAKRV